MSDRRIPSIDHGDPRGQKLSDGLPDEIDAVVANRINSPSSSTRTAADGRYRTLLLQQAPGTFDITVGTGVDDSGEEPVSVTDEAVAQLVASTVSATRAMLDSLYLDPSVLGDEDVAALVSTIGTLTRAAVLALINSEAGDVADDADIATLISTPGTATRAALDSRYSLPPELVSGAPPSITVHGDMGTGAAAASGGTRLVSRATVATGANPVGGGILCTYALTGYSNPPIAFVNPRDHVTAAANLFVVTSETTASVVAAGELNARTAYSFELMLVGY